MDGPPDKPEEKGVPAWVMTFADLMTLLMCFFVLLLAFSEMDVAKFKQLSGSLKNAFGVQAEVDVKVIPKGTSIIAKEYRDRLMADAAREHPHYGWERNKGYGSKEHLEALRTYGPTPLHRRSFAPVAQMEMF